jgi:hypothetical protein
MEENIRWTKAAPHEDKETLECFSNLVNRRELKEVKRLYQMKRRR